MASVLNPLVIAAVLVVAAPTWAQGLPPASAPQTQRGTSLGLPGQTSSETGTPNPGNSLTPPNRVGATIPDTQDRNSFSTVPPQTTPGVIPYSSGFVR